MPTIVRQTDFEAGTLATIFDSVVDTTAKTSIDATVAKNGTKSMKLAAGPSAAAYAGWNLAVDGDVVVVRYYLRFATLPGSGTTIRCFAVSDTGLTHAVAQCLNPVTNNLVWRYQTVDQQTTFTVAAGQWYLIDARLTRSGITVTIDWSVNGVAQTQATSTIAGLASWHLVLWGANAASASGPDINYDDAAYSITTGDYPLGPPGGKVRVRAGGSFTQKPTAVRAAGAFVTKPVLVRKGGSFTQVS